MASDTRLSTDEVASSEMIARLPVSWKSAGWMAFFALVSLVFFGFGAEPGQTSTFALSLPGDDVQLTPLELPSRAVAIVLSLVCVGLAIASAVLTRRRRRTPVWMVGIFGLAWVLAFLVWAIEGSTISLTG